MAKIDFAKNFKNITIKLSDGSSVSGRINIYEFPRFSDMFKQSADRFLTVFSEDAEKNSVRVYMVNRDYILWAETEE